MHKLFKWGEQAGDVLAESFHLVGLFVVGVMILWASIAEVTYIIDKGQPGVKDVLMLFIYLELGAMVGIYFKTKHLPVRFLIYIAITAITRVLTADIKEITDLHLLALTAAILVLSIAVLALRYASWKYPSDRTKADL